MALVVQKVLSIKLGEVVALMGPNGSGKTSLALGIIGHKNYPLAGKVILDGEDISRLPIDQRVKKGLFLAWQNPVGVRGVSVRQMLKTIGKAEDLEKTARQLRIGKHLLTRDININFSGGEKKKIQLLEMAVLQPKYAILDEIDSGMDADSLKILGQLKRRGMGILLITHQTRVFNYLKPKEVLVMKDRKIVKKGGMELVKKIEENGYAKFK